MSKLIKIFVILLVLASIGLTGYAVYLFNLKNEEIKKRVLAEKKIDDILIVKDKTEKALQKTKAEVRSLEAELDEKIKRIEKLSLDLEKEKSLKESALAQIEDAHSEIESFKQSLNVEKQEKEIFKNELASVKEELAKKSEHLKETSEELRRVKADLKEYKQAKLTFEKRVKDLLGEVSEEQTSGVPGRVTGKIVVKSIEGKVLIVNDKYNFVMIDLGARDGIRVSETLIVCREDIFLGKVRIEKIYPRGSQASILPRWKKGDIQEGDNVKIFRTL